MDVMKTVEADVLIVGAGHSGAQAAIALRVNGFKGSIILVGEEPEPPYERPPLSKEYLAREKTIDRFYIRAPQFWNDKNIGLMLSRRAVSIHPSTHEVALDSGEIVHYRKLIWAAGGEPRKLSCAGADLAGVHAVRTKHDVDNLIDQLDAGARQAVVVGGGYIGLEAAAVLRKLDCEVTLLEALPRVLARVAGPEISQFLEAEHRAHGVDLRTGVVVDCLEGDGQVTGVRLSDNSTIPAEIVIVGVGIAPSIALLVEAGAEAENGILVDASCRSSLPEVYAIGDCAAFACEFAGGNVIRVESVQNANDMAICAAKDICGIGEPYLALPWFWSNQYDLKLQTAGLSIGYDQSILRGDPAQRTFSVLYLKEGRLIALDCINNPKDYVQGRKAVEGRITPDPEKAADPQFAIKDL